MWGWRANVTPVGDQGRQQLDAIYNERVKLFATFLNSVGIAIFAVGGLAPLITRVNGQTGPTLFISLTSAVCFLTAIALHYIASRFLKRMKQ
jgi:hypothetical protein